jgi:tetratricopeptide (TPR) repeat protein
VVAGAIGGGIHFHDSGQRERRPRQIPLTIGTFVNRAQELEELGQATAVTADDEFENSIVIVTGTAGVGKTSLAVRWSHANTNLFPDGQLYLNMRGFDPAEPVEPIDALANVLASLGVPSGSIPNDLAAAAAELRTHLASRRMLLLLDNVATVDQARPLLPGHPGCLALITSRNSLPGLVSREGARRIDLKVFTPADAVLLLKKIVSRGRDDDDDQNLGELATLCACLPLALRVAAERAIERPRESLIELIDELRGESLLWDSLSTDDSERADAIRSVFTWSYRALTLSAARMFRLLGLHPGQEISARAAAALAGVPLAEARAELSRLVNAHMIESVARDRYQLHDLMRAYAVDQVSAEPDDERAAAVGREVAWYAHSAAAAVAEVQRFHAATVLDAVPPGCEPATFASREAAIEWYEAERANLRSISAVAMRYGHRRWVWQLAIALYPIHHATRSSFRDWLIMAEHGLAAARAHGELRAVAEILTSRGVALERPPRQLDAATQDLDKALEIWRTLGDQASELRCLNAMGWVALRRRRLVKSAGYFDQIGVLAEQLPPGPWRAIAMENGGAAYYELGELDTAAEMATHALTTLEALATDSGIRVDPRLEFDITALLARVQRERGLLTEASAFARRMLDITQAQGNLPGYLMVVSLERGRADLALGNPAEALVAFTDAQREFRSQGDQVGEAEALDGIGDAYVALERTAEAEEFYQAAADGFTRVDEPRQAASALAKLAQVLTAHGHADHARTQRDAALDLIAVYDDPRCAALRHRLTDQTGA